MPRGTSLPLPDVDILRLFLHWTDTATRTVDSDLSVFDDTIVFPGYVDLDLAALTSAEVRHVVPVVFAYSDVPFKDLTEAFAGVMGRTRADALVGKQFDVRSAEQPFDLTGAAEVAMPMMVDLPERTQRWDRREPHRRRSRANVARYRARVGHLAADLSAYYRSGSRITMLEFAA